MLTRSIRRIVLPAFRRINPGNVTIRHHWTGGPFRLHSFKHKGYWWYGRNRERETMELFARLIPRGATVVEVGAHIGYMAQYFSMLTGPEGKVICFEPSPENLPYLRENVARALHKNIRIVEAAAGDRDGVAPFFYESITGQNSTTVADFEGFEINSRHNGLPADYQTCSVPMRTLDSFLAENRIEPGFIKIDAEGGESNILAGMPLTLARGPRMMIEVTRNPADVFAALSNAGYLLFDPFGQRINAPTPDGNVFVVAVSDAEAMNFAGGTYNE